MELKIKRVYDQPDKTDGFRVLVDRIWPRGLTKEKAALDLWDKDLSPSTELRKWFNHEEEKWTEFKRRYASELDARPEAVGEFVELLKRHPRLTLLYGAKSEERNQAVALKEYLTAKKFL